MKNLTKSNDKLRLIMASACMAFLFISCGREETRVAFIQNYKLYSEFELAKELDAELKQFSNVRNRELDSLNLVFENKTELFKQMDEIPMTDYQAFNDLRNVIMYRKKAFENELMEKGREYDEQIWERINSYVEDYALENDYDLILGASGDGNLMFAKDTLDLTDELIAYCNHAYKGEIQE